MVYGLWLLGRTTTDIVDLPTIARICDPCLSDINYRTDCTQEFARTDKVNHDSADL